MLDTFNFVLFLYFISCVHNAQNAPQLVVNITLIKILSFCFALSSALICTLVYYIFSVIIQITIYIFCINWFCVCWFCFHVYRTQKRDAWRQARMRSLEQDAHQAKLMIQSISGADNSTTSTTTTTTTISAAKNTEVSQSFFCGGDLMVWQ